MPAFVLDRNGTARWLNAAAIQAFGDRCGEHYSAVVAPEARRIVAEQFRRKILGTARTTSYEAVLVDSDERRRPVEIDSVRLEDQGELVGVFGLVDLDRDAERTSVRAPHLTPRQREVLMLLARGRSTTQISEQLHLSRETVRNHVRGVLRALGAHSRLEAVARARSARIV